jgi:hypothetical protein
MNLLPIGSLSVHPSPAPSRDFDPSKNKVHILGSILILCMDLEFSFFFQY